MPLYSTSAYIITPHYRLFGEKHRRTLRQNGDSRKRNVLKMERF
ncbi:hypothetical protein HMPREF9193_01054 [Treponema lecithinolyticum ATCC 700332]|uniref:Uncharacterized protein n=1 Tax=Treponema lecithinolyticum ATCC 700332 TaxID=1321815 RepID=A0ABN0NZ55_TRELE|nr:hypothetical protein HMPREF9193_01054 [Treponema lecithinolyticum ATCC 700332]